MNDPREWDTERIDEAVLALLYLTAFQQKKGEPMRAWKGHDWDAMERLFEAGRISDPRSKSKSIGFSDEGWLQCQAAFEKLFTHEQGNGTD